MEKTKIKNILKQNWQKDTNNKREIQRQKLKYFYKRRIKKLDNNGKN